MLLVVSAEQRVGANPFVNLDFEQAVVPAGTGEGSLISASGAVPGWTAQTGSVDTPIFYNARPSDNYCMVLYDGSTTGEVPPPQGNYKVTLYSEVTNHLPPATPSLFQNGDVPQEAKSLQFLISFFDSEPVVLINGQQLPAVDLGGVAPFYEKFAVNIQSFAGQLVKLEFNSGIAGYSLDAVSFSTQAVPEPAALALLSILALLIVRREARRGGKGLLEQWQPFVVVAALMLGWGPVAGANPFVNLDFEQAVVPAGTGEGSALPASSAFPGWSAKTGLTDAAIFYNARSSDNACLVLYDNTTSFKLPPPQGIYKATLYAEITNNGHPARPSLFQTGDVPPESKSLQFLTEIFDAQPVVFINGVQVPAIDLGVVAPVSRRYGLSIESFAGQNVKLEFNSGTAGYSVDAIAFSTQAVPEPAALALLSISAFLIVRREARRGGKWLLEQWQPFVVVSALLSWVPVAGANPFVNLDFEQAVVPAGTGVGGQLPASSAFPGWVAKTGLVDTPIYYNSRSSDNHCLVLYDVNGFDLPPPQGNFKATLYAEVTNNGHPAMPRLMQTGDVPTGTKSLQFLTDDSSIDGPPVVLINGINMPTVNLGEVPRYYQKYGVNVESFAGQAVTLEFNSGITGYSLDAIAFSTQAVPEPVTCPLVAVGFLFSLRRARA
ncbi:MAG TPA: hypothetical protein VF669_04485 [Tepidisphaeraceae bacterium]|jgi:hypothetical protein